MAQNKFTGGINSYLKNKAVDLKEEDIAKNPSAYSLMAKLVTSRSTDSFQNNGELSDYSPNLDYLLGISSEKAQEIDDNEAIMQLLPDLERGAQILISYILSPKYLLKPEIQYRPPAGIFTQSVGQNMVDVVKRYITDDYKLDQRLYGILYNILFTKGAYVTAVIPEASLDEFINPDNAVSRESQSYQLSFESLKGISTKLNETKRESRGFLGKPSYHSDTAFSTPKSSGATLSRESVDVTVGNTNQEYTYTASKPTQRYETKIQRPDQVSYEFPPDLVANYSSESNKISLTEKGIWNVNLSNTEKDTLVEVTDDLSLLHQSYAKNQSLSTEAKKAVGLSTEDVEPNIKATDRDLVTKLFKSIDDTYRRIPDSNQIKRLATNEQTYRKNLDEPLIIEYPVESIVPIFKPGSPSEHVGYLALHDEDGNPLSKTKPVNYYRELHNNYNLRTTGQSMASSLIQQGRAMFDGFSNRLDEARQLEILSRIHGNAIIKDILERLRNGLYGKNLDIGDPTEAYRIMFYRSLQGQRTRVLFVPKELMTYMAFDYDAKGMGRSLIDNMKVLISLRIQFMLAQIRAGIMNSIPETVVTLKIDEDDPDPKKTIQIGKVLALQSRSNAGLIVGASNIQTIEDRINQANIRIAIESDNPKVPQVGQDVTRNTADIPVPDSDTADKLEKFTTLGIGLPPEMVENSFQPEFAAQVLQANAINNLTSFQKQERFNPFLTTFIKIVMNSSPSIRAELREIVQSNIKVLLENVQEAAGDDVEIDIEALDKTSVHVIIDYIVDKFIETLEVALPAPASDNHEMKNEQMTQYEEKIDKAIGYILTQEVLPEDVVGERASEYIEKYGNIIKADMMRRWMIENDYFAEIMEYFTISTTGQQTFEKNKEIREMAIKSIKSVMDFFKESKNIAKTVEAVAETNQMKTEGDDYSSSDSSSSDSDSGGGDDSFGGDFDLGGDTFEEGGEGEEGNSGNDGTDSSESGSDLSLDGPVD